MVKNLPHWRVDNIFPAIGLVIAIVVNVGAIFWWGGRNDLKLEQVIENQREQRTMWLQLEGRVGREEKISSVVLNVLKLDIK